MTVIRMAGWLTSAMLCVLVPITAALAEQSALAAPAPEPNLEILRDDQTTRAFRLLGKDTRWEPVAQIEVDFRTFHTQGMAKVGDALFVSAVELLEAPERNGAKTDALYDFTLDRSVGAGRGWLFKLDLSGHLLSKLELGEGAIYHPGGIDYDGRSLWVPVAEYRPNGKSRLYRIDPNTLERTLVLSQDDHLGALVHDAKRGTLHAVSWGARRLYTFHINPDGQVGRSEWTPNPSFYVDYQDCHLRGVGYMLCGGLTSYTTPLGTIAFGGLELVDLWRARPVHQLPVNVFVDEGRGPNPGLALTHNPFWVEPRGTGALRFYFMPESNGQADLRIYDVTP